MKEMTVFLINYTEPRTLQRAIDSLNEWNSLIREVVIINTHASNHQIKEINGPMQLSFVSHQDLGEILNRLLENSESSYVLFLQSNDYLIKGIDLTDEKLDQSQSVMVYARKVGNTRIGQPLIAKTEVFKERKFLTAQQLPFQEALFSAWLHTVEDSGRNNIVLTKKKWISEGRVNSSKSNQEKYKLLRKYELMKQEFHQPSLSILISNFNMEKYIEASITSCFLQQTQPNQVLIIDDGSEDHSYQRIEKWQGHEKVEVFQKKNAGKAKALNDLLPHVKTEFVMELDADDWLDPDAVLTIKQKLQHLPEDVSVLFGNFKKWKDILSGDVLYKGIAKGKPVKSKNELLTYRFPLGPRIYRTNSLKQIGGFPVSDFENGRLYEDVSVLMNSITESTFRYENFTVYNIREHGASITKKNQAKWHDYLNGN